MPCTMYCRPEITVKPAASHMIGTAPVGIEKKRASNPVSTVRTWKNVASLPAHVGRGVSARSDDVDGQGADGEDEVAADHDGGDPEGQRLEPGQRDERGHEQQLVGQRIEERAEPALAAASARDVAIQQIGHGRGQKDGQRRSALPVDEQRHEDRDEQNSQERQPVRETHGRRQFNTR